MASDRKLASRCRLRHAHPAAATQPIVAMGCRTTGRSFEAMTSNVPPTIIGDLDTRAVPAWAAALDVARRHRSRYARAAISDLVAAGFDVLPAFAAPHYSVRLPSYDENSAQRLLDVLGEVKRNPFYVGRQP
jgi:hypothetical protein